MAMETEFSRLIVRLAVFVMASDGSIDASELEALEHLDTLGLGRISHLALEEFERAAREPIDLHDVCDRLKAAAPHGGPLILSALGAIASSNRSVPTAELWALRHVSRALCIPDDVADEAFGPTLGLAKAEERASRQRESRRGSDASEPGSREALVAAYRRAIERYNPEKVIHLGPEYAVLAVRRLARATEAFESAMADLRAGDRTAASKSSSA